MDITYVQKDTLLLQYLDDILLRSAYLRLKESGWKKGILGSDSTGAGTDRYEVGVPACQEKKDI
jgi:hypothetical protein